VIRALFDVKDIHFDTHSLLDPREIEIKKRVGDDGKNVEID
jgi:hypothetical protein